MQVVVLSGGVGSRLWPVCNELNPKPFFQVRQNLTLLEQTYLRIFNIDSVESVTTVVNSKFALEIQTNYEDLCRKINKSIKSHFIIEPFAKNTTAAIISASLWIWRNYGFDEHILILPVDHIISDLEFFQ